ncbi:MAG TPA: hypothetical protein VNI54_02925 [Thermoanaerobaculia bacterium]|nr:hypothetical protein [Thermoanaerobaculia bacterium]
MSEYQYYEFQAIDRRLTADEIAELRTFSTRARITSTSFVNDYQWGAFKGNEDAWMDKYFDAFLYFANWGTHVLKLRLPSNLLDKRTATLYCVGEFASVRERNGKTILTFASEDEENDETSDETDALSALIPIRTQLARGDLRSLYVGWLHCVQAGELGDDEVEPPVPPRLGDRDGSLERLIDFLRIDIDLLEVAAAASPSMSKEILTRKEIQKWIAGRRRAEKDDYLERFIAAEEPALAAELQRRIANRNVAESRTARTVGMLLRAAQDAGDEWRREEAARAEVENTRHEQEVALARSKYLGDLARKEPTVWKEIDNLITAKQPTSYDRAVGLLLDLRDAAAVHGRESSFLARLDVLRTEHARKPSLISKIQRAGLR